MANYFKIKHGFVSTGDGSITGTLDVSAGININGDAVATQAWVNSLGLITSGSVSSNYLPLSGGTLSGVLKLNSELQFYRGSGSDYSNYIRATNYPSESYSGSNNKYWLEYGAKGGHHFILNTDGGAGAGENNYDDFTIWQGEVDGDRLFEVTNAGGIRFAQFSHGYLKTNVNGVVSTTTTIPWSTISSTPTTLSGYGITDAASSSHTHAYNTLTGIPNTFTPSAHTHPIDEIDGLQDQLDGKQPAGNYLTSLPSHNHDDRYVKLSGSTMGGDITWTTSGKGLQWTMNTDGAGIKFYNTGDSDTNSRLEYFTTDNGNEFHRFLVSGDEEMTIKTDGVRVNTDLYIGGNRAATQSWVTGRGYLTSLPAHSHDVFGGLITFETNVSSQDDWENSPVSILERDGIGAGSTASIYAPNLNFHWRNRVSNSLWMGADGILNYGPYSSDGTPSGTGIFKTGTIYVGSGTVTQTKVSNWDTAYGWGDHAAAGYAASSHNHDSRYLVKGGSWNGVNMPGSRWGGFSVNGGEVVFQRDNPNNGQMSVMVDGNFYAGERNGFWSLYSSSPSHNNYNEKVGFYSNASGHFLISTSAVYAGGNQVWHAGNFDPSTKLATTHDITLTLSGDASGSATFTNMGNATLSVTVANDSHTHDGRYYTESESDARFVNVTGDTITGDLHISGASLGVTSTTQGTEAFYVDGVNGRLFTISDDLSDSLFSANTISGLPVIEAFADNTVKLGPYSNPVIIDSSGNLNIGGTAAATESYVDTAISNLIGGAPGALDTLNELAAAINDNASYASSVTTALGTKAPLASPALTGNPTAPTQAASNNSTRIATTAFVKAQGYVTTDTNYYLNDISRSGNVLTFSVAGATNQTYTFGSAAWSATSAFDAAGSADSVNTRIDTEVLPLFANYQVAGNYQPAGNYFTDGDTVLNMANNDGLVFNDSNNLMYVKADGSNYAIIDSRGGSVNGTLSITGGNHIAMSNGNITGVNQITINDPGEGIIWSAGSSGDITLAVTDDASDNILNLSGTGASLAVNGATVATQAWVAAQGFTTSTGSNYYLSGASFNTSNGVLTLTVTGATNQTVDLDGRYLLSGATAVSSTKLVSNGGISTQPGTNNLIFTGQISAGTTGLFSTSDNSNAIITLNRHSGNYDSQLGFSSNGNIYYRKFSNSTAFTTQAWLQVWHSGNFSQGSINNWTTAYNWGNHASAGYASGSDLAAVNDRIDNEVFPAIPTPAINSNGSTPSLASGITASEVRSLINAEENNTTLPLSGGTITGNLQVNGYIKGNGQQLILNAGESHAYATGQGDEKVYINAEQGLEVTTATNNWNGGWAEKKSSRLTGETLQIDGENLTRTNIQNFKTAYGWGDHATAGYLTSLPSHSHTFASITSKPAFVDNGMLQSRSTTATDTVGDGAGVSFNYLLSNSSSPVGVDHALMTMSYSSEWQTQLAQDWRENGRIYIRGQEGGTWSGWGQVWSSHDFNPNSFASSSHTHAAGDITSGTFATARIPSLNASKITSGTLNADRLPRPVSGDWWNGGAAIVGIDGVMEIGKYIDFHDTDTQSSDYSYRITNTGGRLYFSGDIEVDGGDLYLNDGNTRLHEGNGNSLKVTTSSGYIEMAPMNTGHCHIQTDRTNFYFNTQIQVDTGKVSSYNEDLYLQRAGSTKITVGSSVVTFANHITVPQPAPPTFGAANIVGETIEVVFDQSSTSGIDSYQVWSSAAGGSYGLVANIPTQDIAATMTAIDAAFSVSGTHAYRVYAIKNGVYSDPAEGSVTFNVGALDVVNMSVVNLNSAYYIQYDMPSSRFVDHIEIYMDAEVSSGSLSRSGATLIYSGNNTSYMYQIGASDLEKFHQFWVEVVES